MALIGTRVAIAARHHEITIEMFIDTTTDTGYPIEDFVPLVTLYASREPLMTQGSAERFNADQVSARAFDRWTMPYVAAIDPDVQQVAKMRLVYQGFRYDIVEAHTLNMRAEIVMTTMVKAA
jgi:hypothetical protein